MCVVNMVDVVKGLVMRVLVPLVFVLVGVPSCVIFVLNFESFALVCLSPLLLPRSSLFLCALLLVLFSIFLLPLLWLFSCFLFVRPLIAF